MAAIVQAVSAGVVAVFTVRLVNITSGYAKSTRDIAASTLDSARAAQESVDASRRSVKTGMVAIAEGQRQHRLSQVPVLKVEIMRVSSGVLSQCPISIQNVA